MQTQPSSVKIAVLQVPQMQPLQHYISPRTFKHCLNALFVHTKILAGNVISLHLHAGRHIESYDDNLIFLSHFQLELQTQALSLQHQVTLLSSMPLQAQEWICYADLWRIGDVGDVPKSIAQIKDATDLLAGLYEIILPVAAVQPDQSISFYLLAEHLVSLNAYCLALELSLRTGCTHLTEHLVDQKPNSKISPKLPPTFTTTTI